MQAVKYLNRTLSKYILEYSIIDFLSPVSYFLFNQIFYSYIYDMNKS